MRRIVVVCLLLLAFLQTNCFGRFAVIRKIYQFIDDIHFNGAPLLVRFVKTVITWLLFILPIVSGLAFFVDFCIINLIEFWTGENIIDGYKEGSAQKGKKAQSGLIQPGKTLRFESAENGMKLKISRSEDGSELKISSFYQGESREMIARQDEPGVLYLVSKGKTERIGLEDLQNLKKVQAVGL